ncbi:MAG: SurA N-terminal domain-containing protein [Verrucomicrobiae bacterium]
MIAILRKNQRGLMLVVAVLTIVAFIFLYNTSQLDELASTRNPTIYGQRMSPGTIDRQVKNYQLTLALGQFDLMQKLGGNGADQSAALTEFVWNLLVLQHQARVLGVHPTDEEVAARIKAVPVFQTQGQFDPVKYAAFLREQLVPRGFTERQLEEVMRDSLRVEKISAVVESPAAAGELELRDAARVLQPVTGSFVRFDAAAAAAGIRLAPSEVATVFERSQASLNTKESRVVRYVAFQLPAETKLEGRAKVEELQKLTDRAIKFSDSLSTSSLAGAAAAAGLNVVTSPAFDREGNFGGTPAAGEADRTLVAGMAPPSFLLNAVGKATDVIQSGEALYVAELVEINPARPLTLAEATPLIEARLRQTKADEAIRVGAAEKIRTLREAVASGKPFDDAAKSAGLTPEPLANLSPMSESLTPEQRRVVSTTLSLKDGEISAFEPAPWGGVCVYLQSRGPLAEAEFAAKRSEIRAGLLENKRSLLFAEWLRSCREEAKITMPGGRRG